jgi:hypothetical protein
MMKLLPILVLMACTAAPEAEAGEGVVKGVYHAGFEQSEFTPCGASTTMWLETSGTDVWGDHHPGFNASTVLEVEGEIENAPESDEPWGTGFGHLGKYKQRILVTKIISSEPLPEGADGC